MAAVVMVPASTPAPTSAAAAAESQKKSNRIQVSNTKKPLFFYVNLAKRYIQQHDEVELSALGMAITTVVTIAEILKNNGLATEKKVLTSTVGMKDEVKGRVVQKAKIEIVLGKSEKFDALMNSTNNQKAIGNNSQKPPAEEKKATVNSNNIQKVATEEKKVSKNNPPQNVGTEEKNVPAVSNNTQNTDAKEKKETANNINTQEPAVEEKRAVKN